MTQSPPPPPQTSRKRILPAFLLCFVLGAHRIYAGKVISGIVQTGLVAGSFIWTYASLKDLIAVIFLGHHGDDLLVIMTEFQNWQESNSATSPLPLLVMLGAAVWIAADATKLLKGKFTDGKGLPITRWL